jgi:hypothetical protein
MCFCFYYYIKKKKIALRVFFYVFFTCNLVISLLSRTRGGSEVTVRGKRSEVRDIREMSHILEIRKVTFGGFSILDPRFYKKLPTFFVGAKSRGYTT